MADAQVKRKIGVLQQARSANYPTRPASPSKSGRPPSPSKRAQMQTMESSFEQLRPRAKLSSVSAKVSVGKMPPSTLSPGYASGSTTPRAPSPVRQQARTSPKLGHRTLSRVRSNASLLSAVSAPASPRVTRARVEHASLSAATSAFALGNPKPPRVRQASITSFSQIGSPSVVTNGVYSPPLSAVSFSQDSDIQSNVSTQRIKAKVTGLAKGKPPPPVRPTPSTPTTPTTPAPDRTTSLAPVSHSPQFRQRLARTPSIGSLSAPPTPNQVYPITTASPAANVHRYSTLRSPSYTYRPPQSFTSPLQTEHKPSDSEPLLAPPAPLSPPVSSTSFSSQSSASRSSLHSANHIANSGVYLNGNSHYRGSTTDHTIINALRSRNDPAPTSFTSTNTRTKSRSSSLIVPEMDSDPQHRADSSEPDDDVDSEERTMKAEAKSHRKIADLEITTKSLLSINTQLEANKHKQAKEIRDLRRKLRESQLALPPRTYRELKVQGKAIEIDKDDDEPEEQEEDGDEEARITAEAIKLGKDDEVFNRVRIIIESLLTTGKQALAVSVEDLAPPKGTAKVLHEVEARTWRVGVSEGDLGAVTTGRGNATDYISFNGSISSSDSGDEDQRSLRISENSYSCNGSTTSEREVEDLVRSLRSSLSATLQA